MSIIDDVRSFLLEKKLIKSLEEISASDSLLEQGAIDSVGILDLVVFLENTYSIKVDDEDLMPDNFDSLKAIEAFVKGKQA